MSCGCGQHSCGDVRDLNQEDLAREAMLQLQQHIHTLAESCLKLHGELSFQKLELFLLDEDCVRYPTTIGFDSDRLAPHQFAQPVWQSSADRQGYVIYLHESLRDDPQATLIAVSYMIPVINYGEVIEDRHCALFGSAVTGIPLDEYVSGILSIAERLQLQVA